jgi:hypothetical protein
VNKVIHLYTFSDSCLPLPALGSYLPGTLQLDGITADTFESAKAGIRLAIKEKVFAEHGVWLKDEDIVLSGSDGDGRRALIGGFVLKYTLKLPADLQSQGADATVDNATTVSTPVALMLDANAVSQMVVDSVKNVSAGTFTVESIGEPTQDVKVGGACPGGKYTKGGMGKCTSCAPGRAALAGSSNCSFCDPGTYAAVAGSLECSKCWAGFYQAENQSTVCLKCRAHAVTIGSGTSAVRGCVCEQGFYDCTSEDLGVCKLNECNEVRSYVIGKPHIPH